VIDGNGEFSAVAWSGVDERGVGRAGVDAAHSARAAGARATRGTRATRATRASGAAGIHERRIVAAGCDKQKRQAKFWQAHTSRSGASLGGIGRTSQAPTILAVFLMACSTPPERRALPDASAALTLRVDNTSRPLQAWYSIFLHPPEGTDAGGVTADLVVTLVEPAFRCAGAAPSGLDALAFAFEDRVAGARSQIVLARSGPDLGGASGGSGEMVLTIEDDRYLGMRDAGVDVAPGGRVAGTVDYQFAGGIAVSGAFEAPHCAQLDFIATP